MEDLEQKQEVTIVPQDLLDKVGALKALATVHSLLISGLFQVKHHEIINESVKFVSSLHSQVMAEAQAHPDADKVPELKQYGQE